MKLRQLFENKLQFEIDTPPEYIKDINGHYDYSLWVYIMESTLVSSNLQESMDDSDIQQLQKLQLLTAKNITIGQYYIPIFVLYVNKGQIFIQGSPKFHKLIKIDTEYHFEDNIKFPNTSLTNLMFTQLYLFDTIQNMKKFFTIINLKFDDVRSTLKEQL